MFLTPHFSLAITSSSHAPLPYDNYSLSFDARLSAQCPAAPAKHCPSLSYITRAFLRRHHLSLPAFLFLSPPWDRNPLTFPGPHSPPLTPSLCYPTPRPNPSQLSPHVPLHSRSRSYVLRTNIYKNKKKSNINATQKYIYTFTVNLRWSRYTSSRL